MHTQQLQCRTPNECQFIGRHLRDRRRTRTHIESHKASISLSVQYSYHFYVDIFDSLHFYLLHLYHSGLRIKHNEINHLLQTENNKNIDNIDCFDVDFSKLQQLIKQNSTKSDILDPSGHNKFNIQFGITKKDGDEEETFTSAMLSQSVQENIQYRLVVTLNVFLDQEEYDTDSIVYDMEDAHQDYFNNPCSNIANVIDNEALLLFMKTFISNKNLSSSSFSIGLIFYYWPYYKDYVKEKRYRRKTEKSDWTNVNDHSGYEIKDLYIEEKHESLKEELLSSKHVSKTGFDESMMDKATAFMNTNIVKHTKAAGGDWMRFLHYDIAEGSPLMIENLICLIVYCDFSDLSQEFTSTFRPLKYLESLRSIKRRNREFWWLSKILRETVQFFGDNKEGRYYGDDWKDVKGPFYCGMNFVMAIPEFNIRLCSPTSTSKQIEVATRFGGDRGMIIQVNNNGDAVSARYLRCFNCSWISRYSEEDERFFFGGDYRVRIESIRLIETSQNFKKFMKPLFFFDEMINGSDPHGSGHNKISAKEVNVLASLINSEVWSMENKYDEYIMNTFHLLCWNKTQIIINLYFMDLYFKTLYPLIMGTIERSDTNSKSDTSSKNLFRNIVFSLFKNVKQITIYSTPSTTGIKHCYSFSLLSLFDLISEASVSLKIVIYAKQTNSNDRSWLFNAYNTEIRTLYHEHNWNIAIKQLHNARGKIEDCVTIKNKHDDIAEDMSRGSIFSMNSSRRLLSIQSQTNVLIGQKYGGHGLARRKQYQSVAVQKQLSPSPIASTTSQITDWNDNARVAQQQQQQLNRAQNAWQQQQQQQQQQQLNPGQNNAQQRGSWQGKPSYPHQHSYSQMQQMGQQMGYNMQHNQEQLQPVINPNPNMNMYAGYNNMNMYSAMSAYNNKAKANDKGGNTDIIHRKMTYHYQQYTRMQRLPPIKQQQIQKQMSYHYQQYCVMYKEYQKHQQKPNVVKKRKPQRVTRMNEQRIMYKEMQSLKTQRVFRMNEQQMMYLSNPRKFHKIQQLLIFGQSARITIIA